ncbi:MAG: LysR family transcriptional regulator [Elusimicrobia bacterium]|nr:LysR family transcriptional regulator [Elusimicrobiota bacterium]
MTENPRNEPSIRNKQRPRRLHRRQPAVTVSLKALERELGIALFERRGRRVVLTPAGAALAAEAGPALSQWEGPPGSAERQSPGRSAGWGGGIRSLHQVRIYNQGFDTWRYVGVRLAIRRKAFIDEPVTL